LRASKPQFTNADFMNTQKIEIKRQEKGTARDVREEAECGPEEKFSTAEDGRGGLKRREQGRAKTQRGSLCGPRHWLKKTTA